MKLKTLTLTNFKGIKSLELNFDGKNASIYADNGLGKTTLFDAYNWLLSGKDSLNRKDFGIKPYDGQGGELHNLDSIVEAVFVHPDLKLTRIYREKYTKVRGKPVPEFTGHTTDYYVNDREVKETEYKTYVNGLANEDCFKLLSNPLYFNVSLKWDERRKILFDMCGEIGQSNIFAKNPQLSELTSFIGQNTPEQHKEICKTKLTEIDKQIQDIPVRINEAQGSIQGIDNLNLTDLKHALEALKNNKDLKLKERTIILAGGNTTKVDLEIAKIETEIQNFTNKFLQIQATARSAQFKLYEDAAKKQFSKTTEINSNENDVLKVSNEIVAKEKQKAVLLSEYKILTELKYDEPDGENTCPTCKQSLPVDQLQAAKEKAIATFNIKKSENVTLKLTEGKGLKADIEKLGFDLVKLGVKKLALTEELEELKKTKESLESKDDAPKVETQVEYIRLVAAKEALKNQTTQFQETPQNDAKLIEIDKMIAVFEQNETEINQDIIKLETAETTKKRIEELKAQEKQLSAQYSHWSKQKDLCEQFTKAKITMVETLINGKFQKTKWKMFDEQVNGEMKECCLATFEGVPYPDLNNAMRINLGLDIINALSNHYKDAVGQPLRIPIFVDNSESVTKLADMETQIIRLVVSENDKILRMEVEK